LRIIAGKFKSRTIYSNRESVKNCVQQAKSSYRPTTDRAKETLFNVLNNLIDFESVTCLDLFSGSGALGFESISRGAASCDFVDLSLRQLNLICRTAKELDVENQVNVYNSEVLEFLEVNDKTIYDLIFADPPYNYDKYDILVNKVLNLNFGVFVIEHSAAMKTLYDTKRFDVISKTIGITNFKIFSSKE